MSTSKPKPCARCGIHRKDSRNHSTLCRDCQCVLTKEEKALWMPTMHKIAA
jgi:hypothetical protein